MPAVAERDSIAAIGAAGRFALEALHAENRASAARLRACHALYEACEDEYTDAYITALCGEDNCVGDCVGDNVVKTCSGQVKDADHDRVRASSPDGSSPADYAVLDPFSVACAELVAAYGVHHNRAKAMLNLAKDLVLRFPAMLDAMDTGRLDERTASMLANQMRTVDERHRDAVHRAVIDWLMSAIDSGRRPGRYAILEETDRIIGEHDPEGVLIRRQQALRKRNVSMRRGIDGMADLRAHLSSPEAQAIYDALDKSATEAKNQDGGDLSRGVGEYRADALVDALLGPAATRDGADPTPSTGPEPARVRPNITVLMPLTPLGEPEVYLPRGGAASIDALISLLSRSVGATITVANPEPGAADTAKGARNYRLSAELARRIRQRDGTCRHPGCSVPADNCDVDHVRPFSHSDPGSGGLTIESNLMCLCRNHHRFKTFYGWRYRLSPDGTLTITTDTGHTVTTEPTGPLALWRRLEAQGSTPSRVRPQEDDGSDDDMPGPSTCLSPTAHGTHWHRRMQRLAAERRANIAQREAEAAAARHGGKGRQWDPDPPPF